MRIVAVSDLHLDAGKADALVAAAEGADLVIGAGDFGNCRRGVADYMKTFEPIAERMIVVPGNNESVDELQAATSATVLHGGFVYWQGVIVAGIGGGIPPLPPLPWQSWDLSEDVAAALLDKVPAADILISHSPPYGVGDAHAELGHIGAKSVKSSILRLKPRLCVFGHVHDCWGESGTMGPTQWRNLGPDPVWFDF